MKLVINYDKVIHGTVLEINEILGAIDSIRSSGSPTNAKKYTQTYIYIWIHSRRILTPLSKKIQKQ